MDDVATFEPGRVGGFLLRLDPVAGTLEQTKRGKVIAPARPPLIRFCGPLGGVRLITDPEDLRSEADRLYAAADALEQAAAEHELAIAPTQASLLE